MVIPIPRRPTVYPRECGGTTEITSQNPGDYGLSPRVRGNLSLPRTPRTQTWSIPASAGEPYRGIPRVKGKGVYPRECGGTIGRGGRPGNAHGLSPRVRGNRGADCKPPSTKGSIPASAGEPAGKVGEYRVNRVYPRECGGTVIRYGDVATLPGLSPRVRGNPLAFFVGPAGSRSIPASAGEPSTYLNT